MEATNLIGLALGSLESSNDVDERIWISHCTSLVGKFGIAECSVAK
jgi:hypothetical protein